MRGLEGKSLVRKVISGAQYYRPPRRVPRDGSDGTSQRSRTRDIIFLFGGIIILSLVLFGVSHLLRLISLHTMSLGIFMFAVILIWVGIGVGFAVGITYYVMQSFLKREFRKRFDRMDKERHARYQRMRGLDNPDDKDEKQK